MRLDGMVEVRWFEFPRPPLDVTAGSLLSWRRVGCIMAFQTSITTDAADHQVSDHIYLSLLLLVK